MNKYSKLSPVGLGIAFGFISGLSMMIFAWMAMKNGHGMQIIDLWSSIFPGYAATWGGGVVGAAWGFVEGFVTGLITAWVYNLCTCCGCPMKGCCGCGKSPCECGNKKQCK